MNFDFRLPHAIATSPRTYPYQSSISSSASSSSSSVFSVDASSSQTSESSSGSIHWDSEDPWRPSNCRDESAKRVLPPLRTTNIEPCVALEQRQHPRRCSISASQRQPPTLIRQSERKGQFVDCLVDSATQMVEVIWPLSVPTCRSEPASGQGVLPLRTFIQETLRRSRTSFSTLQVALYYLILIKAHVPKFDFTMEQPEDLPSTRALQCGRRMFLAALILASKYLQDRNYSARAWSKISGLKVPEINTNEMAFLQAVNWKLHVPESLFERWQDTLIKYTSHTPSTPGSPMGMVIDWKTVVPLLTPELDTVNVSPRKQALQLIHPEPRTSWNTPRMAELSHSQESTPTPLLPMLPRVLEPSPNMLPPTPCLARMGPLPTPIMTPQSAVSNTPAASLAGYNSRRPSMCSAMSQAHSASMARSVMDCNWSTKYPGLEAYQISSRRPSVQSTSGSSSSSSPESMVSDHSRSSRASSISSVSSISSANPCAPTSVRLARLATMRCAGLPYSMQQMPQKEYETIGSITNEPMCAEPMSSPDMDILRLSDSDMTIKPPVRARPSAPYMAASDSPTKRRKRGRSSVDLQHGVRALLGNNAKSYLADPATAVLPDRSIAQSFLLDSSCLRTPTSSIGPKALQSPARSVPEGRLPVQKDLGRKRACCASEANNIMRFDGRGPGIWDGIL
ncbi:hypothetical protein EJ08DRAFT_581678 [Tothia fuscella]|uniref:G1/S-specific cyclin pas1 n=1 Tax=Tothia fuscella TaxID=1048955 RepID=A0A9P4P0P6_9PEZI|nr:hypothetical protein EJ08DRAFT_581678 [Tothia fuscella]